VDRNTGSGPNIFKRYFISSSASVSSVSYDDSTNVYMVASSDGHLTFVNASDVQDPTSSVH
jgi:hypothetical protein